MAVKNSDMYYAYSNNEGIKEKGEYGGVVTTIMKHLLESNVVDGIVAVKEGFDLYDVVPCLITDPEEVIKTAGSIHCGTVNLASFIYKYLDGCRDMKIAVTCKPCDAMSIRELMKKGKIIEDNVIMIGVNCGGTLPPVPTMQMIRDVYELDPSDVIKEEIAKGVPLSEPLKNGGLFPPMVVHMMAIGEETGEIEEMLDKLADYYDEEVEVTTQTVLALLEPMIIVFMAIIVVILIAAIMGPMLSLYNGVGNM